MEESVNLRADALARWFCESPQGRKPPDIGVNLVCVPAGNARASLGRWGRQRGTGKGAGWAGAGRRVTGRTGGVGGVKKRGVYGNAGLCGIKAVRGRRAGDGDENKGFSEAAGAPSGHGAGAEGVGAAAGTFSSRTAHSKRTRLSFPGYTEAPL